MLIRLIFWVLRMLAWPWAGRSLERWPAAPREIIAGAQRPMAGKAPRPKGGRMDFARPYFYQQAGALSACFEVSQ